MIYTESQFVRPRLHETRIKPFFGMKIEIVNMFT